MTPMGLLHIAVARLRSVMAYVLWAGTESVGNGVTGGW